jgi:mTERF domain-containing protein
VLPKIQFLLSKGASNSDIVNFVSKNPRILSASLKNCIVPTYELVYRFLQSDNDTIACVIQNRNLLCDNIVTHNITMLVESGVANSNISRMLWVHGRILHSRDLSKLVDEVKDLGFNPSKINFSVALIAKASVAKTLWKEKVDAFKKWGWSDEDALEAFRKKPYCMLTSIDKINLVMNFWVNQMGWDAMAIAKTPFILTLSLEKRIIPRAAVVQFLLNKGLINKNASLTNLFVMTEKLFLDMLIRRFKNESSYLLKLYEEKRNHA